MEEKDTRAAAPRSLTDTELAKIEKLLSEVRPDGGWIFGDDGTVGRSFGRQDTWVLSEQEAELLTDLADAAPSLISDLRSARAAIRWALGEEGDFPTRRPGEGAYWWRTELSRRAELTPGTAAQPPPDSVSESVELREARRLLGEARELWMRLKDAARPALDCTAENGGLIHYSAAGMRQAPTCPVCTLDRALRERSDREVCGACLAGVLCARHAGKGEPAAGPSSPSLLDPGEQKT